MNWLNVSFSILNLCVSCDTNFQLNNQTVEVYLIQPAEIDSDAEEYINSTKKKSAMDKNPEMMAMLEMTGKEMFSHRVRAPDVTTDDEEIGIRGF